MPFVILTLVIGADYRAAVKRCCDSKRAYAARHGYDYIEGDETDWDRSRPIAWSKIPFILRHMSRYPADTLFWLSDADVLITNPDIRLEDHIMPIWQPDKQVILTYDSCHHVNSGNMFFRNTDWVKQFWQRVWEQTDYLYHIWWENAGMINLLNTDPAIADQVQITNDHTRFNAYLRGIEGEPLWMPGMFLVHFAGVYGTSDMGTLVDIIEAGNIPRLPM